MSSLTGDSGLANPRFQVDAYAKTASQASALQIAIRAAVLGAPALGAVLVGEGSGREPDTKLFRRRQEFSCWVND